MRRWSVSLLDVVLVVVLASRSGWAADPTPPGSPTISPPSPTRPARSSDASPPAVVAVVDGQPVTAAELDAGLQIQLYDLDAVRHALRAARLRELVVQRVLGPRAATEHRSVADYVAAHAATAGQSEDAFVAAALASAHVQILLAAPTPPLLVVGADDDPVRGTAAAPVTIVEFADFQCPNSRRMQPVLRRVLDAYAGSVRLVMRDLPRPFHRNARLAAEAADCAGEQGSYWPYHDLLFQNQDVLERADLEQYARRLNLDGARFAACLSSGRFAAEVEADAAQATQLGVRTTPTFFVNGRYLKGAQSYADFAAPIDAELARLGKPGLAATTPPPATAATATEPTAVHLPDSTLSLSRAEVDRLLAGRAALEQQLGRSALELEQKRLLVVSTIAPGDLYERLGLRAGDVLMQVDGAWVDSEQNPLWAALRDRRRVTLTIMRRGLPQRFEYVIE
jgi:protein-disulfide isomerase